MLVLASFLAFRPIESSSISAPSNLGGIRTVQSLQLEQANPIQATIFDYLGIGETDLGSLDLVEIDPSDDYYVFTHIARGNQPETVHSHQGQAFYDSPLSSLLPRTNQPIEVLAGTISLGAAGTNSGIADDWFAIEPASGNIIVRKSSAQTVQVSLRSDTAQRAESGDMVRFGLAITTPASGSTTRLEQLSLTLPDELNATNLVSADSPFSVSLQNNTIELMDPVHLGGNRDYWIEFDATVAVNEGNDCVLARATVNNQPATELSERSCLAVNTEPAATPASDRQLIRRSVELEQDANTITLTASHTNFGTSTTSEAMQIDISDLLEYTRVSAVQSTFWVEDDQLKWPPLELTPGQTRTHSVEFRLIEPQPTTPIAETDAQSYDGIVQAQFGATVGALELDESYLKQIEKSILQLPVVSRGLTVFGVLALLITVEFLLLRQLRAVHDTKSARRAILGGLKHEVQLIESSKTLMGLLGNNGLSKTLAAIQVFLQPRAVAWATAVALIGMSILTYQARSIGLELSGSEIWVLLFGGWLFGLLLDRVHAVIR